VSINNDHPEKPRLDGPSDASASGTKRRPVLLESKGLKVSFKDGKKIRTVLDGIDLEVRRREFVTIIGPSGCGKSTFLRTVAGLENASGGTIAVDGKAINGPGPDRGMVFQSYSLFPWLTVLQNVMFPLRSAGNSTNIAEAEAWSWVELVGLKDFASYFPSQLSGGMKQRVAIARALAARPRMLLMDEPFGALDARTRAKMQAYLLEIWHKVDVTVLFVTHDLDEAILLSGRIVVLAANPGRGTRIIDVDLPYPRTAELLHSNKAQELRKTVDALIQEPEHETPDTTLDFPVLRVAADGDDVP